MPIWLQVWGEPVARWTQRDWGVVWQLYSYPRTALNTKWHWTGYLLKLPILYEILVLLRIYWPRSQKQSVPTCAGHWLGSVEIVDSVISAVLQSFSSSFLCHFHSSPQALQKGSKALEMCSVRWLKNKTQNTKCIRESVKLESFLPFQATSSSCETALRPRFYCC